MIEKSFERKFILRFTGIVSAGMGAIAMLFYSIIPSSEVRHYADAILSFIKADDALSGVIRVAIIAESIVISCVVVLVAVLASHKIAGPVYSLRRALHELVSTRRVRPVTFRNYDQLQDTAGSFNMMIKGLNEHFSAVSDAYEEFEGARKGADNTPESVERMKKKVDNLGKAIERFRV